jgi:hypothetical protein
MTARILIVDDVPATTRLLEAELYAEYCQVTAEQGGVEAMPLAQAWQPDLILRDVIMSDMDAHETCRRLKADPNTMRCAVSRTWTVSAFWWAAWGRWRPSGEPRSRHSACVRWWRAPWPPAPAARGPAFCRLNHADLALSPMPPLYAASCVAGRDRSRHRSLKR